MRLVSGHGRHGWGAQWCAAVRRARGKGPTWLAVAKPARRIHYAGVVDGVRAKTVSVVPHRMKDEGISFDIDESDDVRLPPERRVEAAHPILEP